MKRRGRSLLALIPLAAGAVLSGPAASAAAGPAPVVAQAATPANEVYVSEKHCDWLTGGDGSMANPYCMISSAAEVAQPGQTVLVQPGNYEEGVFFTRSGTEGAPITYRAVNGPDGEVHVGAYENTYIRDTVFHLYKVHDIVLEGFSVHAWGSEETIVVNGSSRITLDGLAVRNYEDAPGLIRLTGGSSDVTVSRNFLASYTRVAGVAVDAGVSGTVVSGNAFRDSRMVVADAPGTVVTGNTIVNRCDAGILVTGAAPGVSLRNNIIQTADGVASSPSRCATPSRATAISVSADSTQGTTVDHNLIDPTSGGAPYDWAGTAHPTLASFQAASGQGGHDLVGPAGITGPQGSVFGWYPLTPGSPAIDSADATAPGALPTDLLRNPHADPPDVSNTGTGPGYHDRGATEYVGTGALGGKSFRRSAGGDPLDAVATLTPKLPYPTDGPGGTVAFKFGDERFWRVGHSPSMTYTFRRAGHVSVTGWINYLGFRKADRAVVTAAGDINVGQMGTIVGATYHPVAPARLLDTRSAVGVPTRTAVPAGTEVVLPIAGIGVTPAADITAVVLNVTATQPSMAGFLTVYPDGTALPSASSVNFVAGETVPNLVTVPMSNGKVRIRNGSGGTVHVIADLQGWYGAAGSGLKTLAPTRVLDTRGAGATAFPANTTRQVDLSAALPSDATAVILNVTATGATAHGVLKLFPAGAAVPVASNLNFVAGQTIPNLVIVPVTGGRVSIHNESSGSTHVVADLAGYFGSASSGAADSYVPMSPARIVDTRQGSGLLDRWERAPLQPREDVRFLPWFRDADCVDGCPAATAAVVNLTATEPTTPGVLTAYPATGTAPPTASNVNFVAGETASNLAVVRTGTAGQVRLFNNSGGTTHAVVDQSGYFIAPAV
ncbi:right-handed parallel beta-helix repeat-containing protein [Micromonospora sp. WMMD710]|uniref:right-handed parallel beta-helix repeat-containing protein n=1 Tax=Micromonospora sp. WMMD710 TaxID=3016085 RepID=UPI002416A460|nr:right-handed parallel beta-helix repeat-containing protein [Micromonospora sp. WMMD710]MDG4761524.1 right-handed parallel beta-helix repeat-containing protein [Micromonospora sp. WMMD710]